MFFCSFWELHCVIFSTEVGTSYNTYSFMISVSDVVHFSAKMISEMTAYRMLFTLIKCKTKAVLAHVQARLHESILPVNLPIEKFCDQHIYMVK